MYPKLIFTAEQTEKINEYLTELEKSAKEFAYKYVLGVESGDDAWNKWIAKAKSLGCDEYIKIVNDVQKEYDKGRK